jgi:hypothetical protein
MRMPAVTMLLVAVLSAGCAGVEMGAPVPTTEQARCEQQRDGGVWVAPAGACIRGGASM